MTTPKEVRNSLRAEVNDQVDSKVNEMNADVRELRGLLRRSRRRPVSVEAMNAAVLREHAKKP